MPRGFPEWPALLAILVWASLAAVAGGTLEAVAPQALLAVSLGAAAVALAAIELARGTAARQLLRPAGGELLRGILGLGGYHALLFVAFQQAPLVEANLLNCLWPLLTVLLAAPLAGERLSGRALVGAALGLLGAVAVVGGEAIRGLVAGERAPPAAIPWLGYGCALGAALTWSTFSVSLKRRPLAPASLPAAAALSAVAATGWALGAGVPWPAGAPLLASLYLGALPMGAATLLWEAGIRRGRVSVAGALAYLEPLLSTLGVWLVLGRPLTVAAAAGGAAIVAGAVLGSSGGSAKVPAPEVSGRR